MITLTYQSATVKLKNPEYGNSEKLDLHTLFKKMLNGTVYCYTLGTITEKISFSISNLRLYRVSNDTVPIATRDELMAFIVLTAGKTFSFTDWNGTTRNVAWANPSFTFKQLADGKQVGSCWTPDAHQINFELHVM